MKIEKDPSRSSAASGTEDPGRPHQPHDPEPRLAELAGDHGARRGGRRERPSAADDPSRPATRIWQGEQKYDHHDLRNVLERASARETAIRVTVGAVCKCLLRSSIFASSAT